MVDFEIFAKNAGDGVWYTRATTRYRHDALMVLDNCYIGYIRYRGATIATKPLATEIHKENQ